MESVRNRIDVDAIVNRVVERLKPAMTGTGSSPSSPSPAPPKAAPSAPKGPVLSPGEGVFETVDEVGRVCQREGIDCHWAKGGKLVFASADAASGVRNVLKRDNVVEAISICDATPGPVARLVKVAILNRERGSCSPQKCAATNQ